MNERSKRRLELLRQLETGSFSRVNTLEEMRSAMVGHPAFGTILVDNEGVESYSDGAGNPGFRFRQAGSELRSGPRLAVEADLRQTDFNGWTINPLAFIYPNTIVHPYRFFVQRLPESVRLLGALIGS
jgi:hypothetical protein